MPPMPDQPTTPAPTTAAPPASPSPRDHTSPHSTDALKRVIGFWGASAVMLGIIIGGGIFSTPLGIAAQLDSPALILTLWALGGVLCLFGALTYAELAAMHPESGGIYVFLREGYGNAVAFVFGWTYLLITKPAGAAGVCMLFAANFCALFDIEASTTALVTVTIATLITITTINALGVKLGAGVAVALTAAKFGALAAIVILGVIFGGSAGSAANFTAHTDANFTPVSLLVALPAVMGFILWTYDGWSDVGAIAGEVKNPQRTLPLVYLTGLGAIILVYVAVNAVYLWLIPLAEMRAMNIAKTETIAPTVMDRLIGPAAATIVTSMIVVSTLGSTHGSVLTGARVTFAQARDKLMFAPLGLVSKRFGTPYVSLWVQCLLCCAVAFYLKTFAELANAFIFTIWIFYALAGSAIFVLRIRRPHAHRPYRCTGYPVVPALFVLVSAAMTVLSIYQDPGGTLPWLGLLALGFPMYLLWKLYSPSPRTT